MAVSQFWVNDKTWLGYVYCCDASSETVATVISFNEMTPTHEITLAFVCSPTGNWYYFSLNQRIFYANVSHAVICELYGQLTDWLSNAFLMMFMYLRCVDDLLFNHIHTGRRAMFDRPLSSFLLLLLLKWSHSNDIHRNKEHKKHWKPKWFLLYTK